MSELSQKIKARRLALGLSQDELAKRLGYHSRSSVNKIESGKNNISLSKIQELARALETTPAELLSENELDTSVVDNTRTTKGCTFTLPEGFEASEDVEGMYVTGRYPIDASLIYYAELEQDMGMQLMTEASFKEQTQDNFREVYGEDVEVMIDSFEQLKMQGYPAFRIQCHYQVGDVKITQLAYAINADKSYVITYSQTNDYDRMEEYEASAQTIQVEY